MAAISQRIPLSEKLGYGLGDAAANFVFQSLIVFQLSFYTDTFGLTAGAAALLLLVARCADAFFDPLFGILADRTSTRFGKFRPWVIATAIPYGIMAVVAFSTPDFGYGGKLVYAYVTYLLLMLVYSANNLPYSALSGVMTGDLGERTSLSSYRFMLAISASFVVQAIAPQMLQYFSHGRPGHYDPHAYQVVMGIFGILSVVFFVITFATTKERISPPAGQHASIAEDLKGLGKNGPWFALFALTILVFITLSMRGGTIIYYFQYYLKRQDLFGWFNGVSQGASLLGILFSKPLAMRFGKKLVFIWGLGVTAVLTAVFMLFTPDQIELIFVTEAVRSFAYGFTIPLLWAMMADVADYSEWKTGRRATGIVFSAIVFGLKAGLGFGGAIAGWLLASYGYVANVDQSATALSGIRLTSSVYASIPFFLGVVCLFFYSLNKQLNIQITDELATRRKSNEPGVLSVENPVLAEAP
ncbi:MAG TPA: glycoside-pentoside-hexuronide (GPH):cation symporter [Phycisphaerae bacterium]|nr:glycoside-pentoside-hexuronide (GPH):cation symporter [Phycisphaerae bacterium]